MPMPPPKPTTEGPRDRRLVHEMDQLVRAARDQGPLAPDDLSRLVGAPYWEKGRFESAVSYCLADGRLLRTADGLLASA